METVEAQAPCVVIHNNFTMHRANVIGNDIYERYIINFSDNALSQSSAIQSGTRFFKNVNMAVIRLTEKMTELLLFYVNRYPALRHDPNAKNHLTALILYELSLYQSEENTTLFKPKLPYINDIMNYITHNASEPITLESLAAQYFISRAKLVADFRSTTGMTVKGYITLVRMNLARKLLLEGHSVSETAGLCGYNSESNFIATFKKSVGVSPGYFPAYITERRKNLPPEMGTYENL